MRGNPNQESMDFSDGTGSDCESITSSNSSVEDATWSLHSDEECAEVSSDEESVMLGEEVTARNLTRLAETQLETMRELSEEFAKFRQALRDEHDLLREEHRLAREEHELLREQWQAERERRIKEKEEKRSDDEKKRKRG